MDDTLLYILIVAVFGLFGWGVTCLVGGLTDGRKRKLHDRLTGEDRVDPLAAARRSVVQQRAATGLPPWLNDRAFIIWLQRRLVQAFPDWSLRKFLYVAVGLSSGMFLVTWVMADSAAIGAVAGVVGLYAPLFLVNSRRTKRQKLLAVQIPDALDFLSRILRAGHSLTTGLQMMGEELPKPIGEEFRRCYDQHSLGQPLDDCLKGVSGRIESTDFAFFVTAVLIQRQSGGDLSEVLNNISGMIRQRIRLQQHVKAKTAEGRFTGYILVAFPAVMFLIAYVLNPGYAGILVTTSTGRMLLMVSFGLCCLGLYAIRKITTVKV